MRTYIIYLLCTFLLMTFILPVSGQQNETREIKIKEQVSKIESAKVNLKPNEQKINSAVLQKIDKMAAELNSGNLKSLNIKQRFSDSVSPVDDMGKIRVKLAFDKTMNKEGFELIVDELQTQNVEILTAYYPEDFIDWYPEVVCLVAYDQIKEIAGDDRVNAVLTASDPVSKIGDYETEGDAELFAAAARVQKGVDGSGIRVGVVSRGAQGRVASIANGDLPTDIVVLSDDNDAEGTAMMEIIYDLAPGCAFTFASAGASSTNMRNEISRMISVDGLYCKIVVDDIGWFDDPYFTDGVLAQYIYYWINNNNIIYISAAGNEAECLYSAHFDGDGNEYHLFNTSGATPTDNWISLPASTADTEFKFYLQWADDWDEALNDYDLYLYNSNDQEVAHSTTRQGSGNSNPPLEVISYQPGVSSGDYYYLRIKKYSGEACDLKLNAYPIHLQFVGPSGQSGPSDQIFGHPAAEGVISVAAYHTDEPDQIASYSSRGPTKIFLGNYTFETRNTPTITATSNVETSIADFRPFPGTSAAAPHIAGIAALYLDYYGYSASSPEDFYDDLTDNADGIAGGTGGTWNKHSGYGKANALEALGGGQYPTIVDQKKSNGASFDKIYHWESAWEDYNAPAEFYWSSGSNHSLKASSVLDGDEKFHHWKQSDYKFFEHFDIAAGLEPIVSQFENEVAGATVKNTFADGFTLGTIEFKDPWLRDYYESPYGYRNRGLSAPLKSYTSPYSVSTGSGHQGVFLNQDPSFDPLLPNYSVGVPETMNFGGSIGSRKVYLINWTALPDFEFATFQNPTAQETGVVFHYPNATVSANIKASQLSNTSSAYSNNGQRKLIETKIDGVTWLHQVYASGNHVWIEHSNDGGATWTLGNNRQPLDGSSGGAKNPSIAYTYQDWGYGDETYYIGIVWQEKYGSTYRIKGKMCNQMSGGSGIPGLFSSTMTLYTEPLETYAGYNTNPNLCLDGGWAGPYLLTIEKKYTSGNYPAGINWFVGHIQGGSGQYDTYFNPPVEHGKITGTNSSSTNIQLYVDDYHTISANFIYQQGNYSGGMYSGSLYFYYYYSNWYLNEYIDGLISYPYANISPAIVTLPGLFYLACWVEYEVLAYRLCGASSLTYYDSGVRSCSINQGANSASGYIAWSKQNYSGTWYNKSMRFDNGSPNTSTLRTLNTTGKYVQLGNGAGSDLSNMRVSSFYPFSSPYYFKTSNALNPLPKVNSNVITGRGFMILNDEATFSYRLEGLNVDGNNINFVDVPDTMNFGRLDNLNNALITEPFQVTANSNIVFTEKSGFADSLTASKKLAKKDYIKYKVELIDDATGKVLGKIKDKSHDAGDTPAFKTYSFKLNTKGLTAASVRARITVETNIINEISSKVYSKGDMPPEINNNNRLIKRTNILLTKSYLEENEAMAKSALEELAIAELEIPQTYDLAQNYPNPFNPVTTIRYNLPEDTHVSLVVYNVNGQKVRELVNSFKPAGSYTVTFDAKGLASGVYFYKIQAGKFNDVKRMLLIK